MSAIKLYKAGPKNAINVPSSILKIKSSKKVVQNEFKKVTNPQRRHAIQIIFLLLTLSVRPPVKRTIIPFNILKAGPTRIP